MFAMLAALLAAFTNIISRGVCWSISHRVGWSVGCSIDSGIGRLHYVFTSTLLSH
jgi:hypothetical protein